MHAGLLGWYGPDRRPRTDTLLLLGLLALAVEEGLAQWLNTAGLLRLPRSAVAALCLPFARRYPVASAVLPVLTGGLFSRAFPALFSVHHPASLGRTGAAAAGGTVVALLSATRADSLVGRVGTTGSQLLVQAAVLSGGLWPHGRRVLIRALHEQVETLRRERELRAEQASSPEPARTAREMHDVLAHRLSLLVLHAGVLRDQARAGTVAADPDRLTHRLELLRTTPTARSLDDLRDVLGVLRGGPPEPPAARGGAARADRDDPRAGSRPARPHRTGRRGHPGRAAGRTHPLRRPGGRTDHPPAGGAPARPGGADQRPQVRARRARHRPGRLRRPGHHRRVRNGPGEASPNGPGSGDGYGLVGLSERVGALGGHLDAGPDGTGGFRLSVRLPAPDRPPPPFPAPEDGQTLEPPTPQSPTPQSPTPQLPTPQPKDVA
ncbi:sensor histidine kinase [Kitasatospora sp. NPDC001159]